jgi:photosystem II stability/assembly factor-like uncharacterized protein
MSLKTIGLAGLLIGSAAVNAETISLYDFENQKKFDGTGYNVAITVEQNPYACGNESAYCNKFVSSNYGMKGFQNTYDLSKYIVAMDVYAYYDVTVRCKHNAADKDIYQQCPARKWTTLYFDFRSVANASQPGLVYIGGCTSGAVTFYVDNIRLVTEKTNPYNCDPAPEKMDVDYTYSRLPIGGGGFVSGVVSDVATGVKYARTDVGGAYKWTPSSCSWRQLLDHVTEADLGMLSVESVAADPQNANNVYLLCGCDYFSGQKTAVLYSRDGGITFHEANLTSMPFFVNGNANGRNNGERLAVDPNNGKVLLAGSRVGTPLAKSIDGGINWTPVTSLPKVYTSMKPWPYGGKVLYGTTDNYNGVSAVVIDGSKRLANGNSARLFVGVSQIDTLNVYRSDDGGDTWNAIKGLPTQYVPVRMKMDSDHNLLLVLDKEKTGGGRGGIYRYNPETGAVTDITPDTSFAYGDVEASPDDANKLVASTLGLYYPQIWDNGHTSYGDEVYTSTDGGKTWRSLMRKLRMTSNGVKWNQGSSMHWCGSLCFDPIDHNKVSFCSGNGIYTCNNIWCEGNPIFYFDVKGLEETVPQDLISVPGGNLVSVVSDYTGFLHTDVDSFPDILRPTGGSTLGVAYAGLNPQVMARVSDQKGFYSEDAGLTWTSMDSAAANKVAISADGSTLVITFKGLLRYSVDKGATFTACKGGSGVSYVAADPVNSSYFYAVAKNKIYISKDGGRTFADSSALTNNGNTRISVVPGHEGLIYAPCGGAGLWVSADHAATFSKLPRLRGCTAVGNGVGKEGQSYVLYVWASDSSHVGLFRSEDQGSTWQIINDERHHFGGPGNGHFVVGDQNHYGRFYMSTVGMGIVRGDVSSDYVAPEWPCFVDDSPCATTGVQTVAATIGNSVSVTPNPFATTFAMDASGDYMVLNVLGSVIERGHYASGARMGSSWPAGIYFVRINGEVLKVVKR